MPQSAARSATFADGKLQLGLLIDYTALGQSWWGGYRINWVKVDLVALNAGQAFPSGNEEYTVRNLRLVAPVEEERFTPDFNGYYGSKARGRRLNLQSLTVSNSSHQLGAGRISSHTVQTDTYVQFPVRIPSVPGEDLGYVFEFQADYQGQTHKVRHTFVVPRSANGMNPRPTLTGPTSWSGLNTFTVGGLDSRELTYEKGFRRRMFFRPEPLDAVVQGNLYDPRSLQPLVDERPCQPSGDYVRGSWHKTGAGFSTPTNEENLRVSPPIRGVTGRLYLFGMQYHWMGMVSKPHYVLVPGKLDLTAALSFGSVTASAPSSRKLEDFSFTLNLSSREDFLASFPLTSIHVTAGQPLYLGFLNANTGEYHQLEKITSSSRFAQSGTEGYHPLGGFTDTRFSRLVASTGLDKQLKPGQTYRPVLSWNATPNLNDPTAQTLKGYAFTVPPLYSEAAMAEAVKAAWTVPYTTDVYVRVDCSHLVAQMGGGVRISRVRTRLAAGQEYQFNGNLTGQLLTVMPFQDRIEWLPTHFLDVWIQVHRGSEQYGEFHVRRAITLSAPKALPQGAKLRGPYDLATEPHGRIIADPLPINCIRSGRDLEFEITPRITSPYLSSLRFFYTVDSLGQVGRGVAAPVENKDFELLKAALLRWKQSPQGTPCLVRLEYEGNYRDPSSVVVHADRVRLVFKNVPDSYQEDGYLEVFGGDPRGQVLGGSPYKEGLPSGDLTTAVQHFGLVGTTHPMGSQGVYYNPRKPGLCYYAPSDVPYSDADKHIVPTPFRGYITDITDSGALEPTVTGGVWVVEDNQWKRVTPWIQDRGQWKRVNIWVRDNNQWKATE